MLVLSRRPNQKVVFPNLGINIQIIRVAGKTVRIGIEAPPDITVLREEVIDANIGMDDMSPVISRQLRHELRNRLNTASLGLQVLHRQLEMGETDDAEPTIFKIFNELQEIDAQMQPAKLRDDEASTRSRRALIVEDNANESELLAAYLRMSGYVVDTVDDGLKALNYLKQSQQTDAVLLDMCMPRLDGAKTITSIRGEQQLRGLKVFAVSGANQHELGVDVGPTGVDRWFTKPVNASQLVSEMNRELDEALMMA